MYDIPIIIQCRQFPDRLGSRLLLIAIRRDDDHLEVGPHLPEIRSRRPVNAGPPERALVVRHRRWIGA